MYYLESSFERKYAKIHQCQFKDDKWFGSGVFSLIYFILQMSDIYNSYMKKSNRRSY